MMQAMKGATTALGSMNRTMNLPSLQRIAMEFERENDIMEQRQEMMDDAIDDAMDVGLEEEGDEVVEQVLEEIGVDLSQAVGLLPILQIFAWLIAYSVDVSARRNPFGATGEYGGRDPNRPSSWRQRWRRRCRRRRPPGASRQPETMSADRVLRR